MADEGTSGGGFCRRPGRAWLSILRGQAVPKAYADPNQEATYGQLPRCGAAGTPP
jgi:hypothetical protein